MDVAVVIKMHPISSGIKPEPIKSIIEIPSKIESS
jgi:hypothetical protein